MKHAKLLVFSVLLCSIIFSSNGFGQNPLISHIYAADPSAHIWPGDSNKLWLYTSHDVAGTNHYATMFDYHVFSTTDLVNWVDYGRVLSVDDVDWAISHGWAIDAVYWHGKYYLFFSMVEKVSGMFRTGIGVSDVPQGPFTNIGYVKGVEWGQDPAVFIDDDNTPYLFWGLEGQIFAAKLNEDLLSIIPESKVELSSQLFECFEGPWVHKYKGKYYLSYPGLPKGEWPEEMYYATSDKPLGLYKSQSKYIPLFKGHSSTNHGSIIKYKNNWIAFHHSSWLSGGVFEERSLMADYLYYNPDGTIKPIIPDSLGLSKGKPTNCIIFLEAENGKAAGGRFEGTQVENSFPGYSGKGYVTGFDVRRDYVEVLVQVAKDMKATLKMRYAAEKDFTADILVGPKMIVGWGVLKLNKTNGWEEVNLGEVELKAGDNKIHFSSRDNINISIKIDYFIVEPKIK